jgi:hypothetical protein
MLIPQHAGAAEKQYLSLWQEDILIIFQDSFLRGVSLGSYRKFLFPKDPRVVVPTWVFWE